jgi:hypothetical protein
VIAVLVTNPRISAAIRHRDGDLRRTGPASTRASLASPGVSQPQPVGGGSFAVDITRAPEAIRQLEQARDELEDIQRDAFALGQITPPTADQVSLDAAQVLAQKGVGGPGSLVDALNAGILEIQRTIDALRAGLDVYQRSDRDAQASFSSDT